MSKLPNNMTNDELLDSFKKCNLSIAEDLKRGCSYLVELNARGVLDTRLCTGPWKYFREIAGDKLDPQIALLARQMDIPYITPFPLDKQLRLVSGEEKVRTVDHNEQGQVVTIDVALDKMTRRDLDLAFTKQGFRPLSQQRRILAARGNDVRRSTAPAKLRADLQTEEVVCGKMRFSVTELATVLKKLGFKVVRTQPKAAAGESHDAHAAV